MANVVYPKWKEAIGSGLTNSDVITDTAQDGIYAALVSSGYTYSSNDQYKTDLGANIVGTPTRITGNTFEDGVLDGGDVTFTSVTGSQVTQIVLYRANSGAESTWRLVAKLDTDITNLPLTPNGGDITVNWNASGIFGL